MWQTFLERLGGNLPTKLVSLFIGVLLWIVVLGSQSFEVTKEVPLEVIPPRDLAVAVELPDRIGFRLAGPKAFVRAVLDRREPFTRFELRRVLGHQVVRSDAGRHGRRSQQPERHRSRVRLAHQPRDERRLVQPIDQP